MQMRSWRGWTRCCGLRLTTPLWPWMLHSACLCLLYQRCSAPLCWCCWRSPSRHLLRLHVVRKHAHAHTHTHTHTRTHALTHILWHWQVPEAAVSVVGCQWHRQLGERHCQQEHQVPWHCIAIFGTSGPRCTVDRCVGIATQQPSSKHLVYVQHVWPGGTLRGSGRRSWRCRRFKPGLQITPRASKRATLPWSLRACRTPCCVE